MSATIPANAGAPAEVPPTMLNDVSDARNPSTQEPCEQVMYPSSGPGSPANDTSGTSRLPSAGTPVPVCHVGLTKLIAAPPPVAPCTPSVFHATSGMYDSAEPLAMLLAPAQKAVAKVPPPSLNVVPPMPVVVGRAAGTSTARPCVATALCPVSQSAAPVSPEAAVIVIPCALPC